MKQASGSGWGTGKAGVAATQWLAGIFLAVKFAVAWVAAVHLHHKQLPLLPPDALSQTCAVDAAPVFVIFSVKPPLLMVDGYER